ncbi:chemotaxis protein CheW [Chitinimonas koreensis]|uniref:chemotaxis protein CheW n=1 Tax=Chitinimonas koreensis TaxID=356302 RepID=UPI000402707F|nr:chemotaxis protein CheW [Chitinimonas koreensis]QNM97538.1 chemotaxis protein CheW [Chitinimonas koreensis]
MSAARTVLPFDVHGLRFALPVAQVVRVLPPLAPQPLPEAPAAVGGICELHGRLVPVYDIRARLGWPPAPAARWAHWIWLRTRTREMLLPVDRTEPVRRLVTPLESVSTLQRSDAVVAGVLRTGDGFYLLHDAELFLTGPEQRALDAALDHVRR